MKSPSFPLRSPLSLALLAAGLFLAGCSKSADEDLPTLHVADQLHAVQSVLKAAGEDQPEGYRIQWSNFVGGPGVIAAQTGGSVDVGWMAETPLVFAQAAGSPVKVVAVSRGVRSNSSNVALVVAASSPIRSAADLKGKKVGYAPGTIAQYLVARALEEEGLSLKDVEHVRIASFNTASLDGTIDAVVTAEPVLSKSLAEGKLRVLAYGGQPLTPGFGYLVASNGALADPKRSELIGDFAVRVARAVRWQRENIDKAAQTAAKTYNVTPEIAADILERTPTRYAPIDAAVVAEHQKEADLFHRLGLIRSRVDAAKLFDNRYDTLIAEAESQK